MQTVFALLRRLGTLRHTAMGSFIVRFSKSTVASKWVDESRFTQRQRAALDYVREHGSITTGVYGRLLGVSRREALKDLASMADSGILGRVGAGRSAHYVLVGGDAVRN